MYKIKVQINVPADKLYTEAQRATMPSADVVDKLYTFQFNKAVLTAASQQLKVLMDDIGEHTLPLSYKKVQPGLFVAFFRLAKALFDRPGEFATPYKANAADLALVIPAEFGRPEETVRGMLGRILHEEDENKAVDLLDMIDYFDSPIINALARFVLVELATEYGKKIAPSKMLDYMEAVPAGQVVTEVNPPYTIWPEETGNLDTFTK